MSRALLVLVGGVLVTLLGVAALAPGGLATSRGFVLVLLTVAAGALVMLVVARRAALRQRAQELRELADHDVEQRPVDRPGTPGPAGDVTTDDHADMEADRG